MKMDVLAWSYCLCVNINDWIRLIKLSSADIKNTENKNKTKSTITFFHNLHIDQK